MIANNNNRILPLLEDPTGIIITEEAFGKMGKRKICPLFKAALLANSKVTDSDGEMGFYAGEKFYCIEEDCALYDLNAERCSLKKQVVI